MLDGGSFWAFPVETPGCQLSRLPVRWGKALRLSPARLGSVPPKFLALARGGAAGLPSLH
jgi:hypothetical protein